MNKPARFSKGLRGVKGLAGIVVLVAMAGTAATVLAHDTWVQVSSRMVRPGDVVHVDLFLGNHGNDHRDFKIAGKLSSLEGASLAVLPPGGSSIDLVPDLVDLGYAPREGFYSGRFVTAKEGLHCVNHLREGIRHGARGLKGAKTYFLVSESLDKPPAPTDDHAKPLGHPLELVLETHPVIDCGPEKPITVRLLHRGSPVSGHRVSFIPRGAVLAGEFDEEHERTTDAEGRCSFTPKEGNLVLVVAHLSKPEESGEGYDRTAYAATLVLDVPQRCPCCDVP